MAKWINKRINNVRALWNCQSVHISTSRVETSKIICNQFPNRIECLFGTLKFVNPSTHQVRVCRTFPFLQIFNFPFLPFFLLFSFFRTSTTTQKGGSTPPLPQLARLFSGRVFSEHANFRIDIWWYFGHLLTLQSSKSIYPNQTTWLPKPIPKWSEILHGKKYHEHIIRVRGAETSNTMLPCERGVHLHKSANFKIISERFQTNKIHFKIIQQMIRNNMGTYYPKHFTLSDLGAHFGAICLKFASGTAFLLATCFSQPLGLFLDRFWPPWGTRFFLLF